MLSDIEAELEREVRDLRAELVRERRARALSAEIGTLAATTSARVTRAGVAQVLARGAAGIFDAAFAFVAYVDDDSIVKLRASPGVPRAVALGWVEAPLDTQIPACAVLRGESSRIELPDIEAMADWPLVLAEVEPAGMGSMCVSRIGSGVSPEAAILVAWTGPHRLDGAEAELLDLLDTLAAPAFERARRTESDGELATAVQTGLREGRIASVDGLTIDTLYRPGQDVMRIGGDWFDVLMLDDGRAAVVIGDVVGHDVRAAIEMSQVRHVLASQLKVSSDPADALTSTDRYLRDRAPHIMATVLVAVFDHLGRLSLASAGHPPPIITGRDGSTRLGVCGLGPPVGAGLGGYSTAEESVRRGDVFCCYTDGIVETREAIIDAGIARLRRELTEVVRSDDPSVSAVISMLDRIVDTPWRLDDAAAVVVRIDH